MSEKDKLFTFQIIIFTRLCLSGKPKASATTGRTSTNEKVQLPSRNITAGAVRCHVETFTVKNTLPRVATHVPDTEHWGVVCLQSDTSQRMGSFGPKVILSNSVPNSVKHQ